MRETQVRFLGREDPLEKEMATHSNTGKSHGWMSLVGYSSWGSKESETTERLHFLSYFSLCPLQWFVFILGSKRLLELIIMSVFQKVGWRKEQGKSCPFI